MVSHTPVTFLSLDLARLRAQRSSNISHHPAKIANHRHFGSRDIIVLVCHMIWHDDSTSTRFISFVRVNSFRCAFLPNLVVIGLIEIELLIPISILARIYRLGPPYWEILKIKNTYLQFQSPVYGWKKNKKKRNTGNCKVLCVSSKHNKKNQCKRQKILLVLRKQAMAIQNWLNSLNSFEKTFEVKFHSYIVQ